MATSSQKQIKKSNQQSQSNTQEQTLVQIQEECKDDDHLLTLYTPFIFDICCTKLYIEAEGFQFDKIEAFYDSFLTYITNKNGISDNKLLLIHVMLVSNFRLLNQSNHCNEQIVSNISDLLLTFNNTNHLWILTQILNDLTDSLYALYNFDIMIQINNEQNKKQMINNNNNNNSKSKISLLSLQRWFTIIYHIYHDIKQNKNKDKNNNILNIKFWNTLSD
eukprot:438885_1